MLDIQLGSVNEIIVDWQTLAEKKKKNDTTTERFDRSLSRKLPQIPSMVGHALKDRYITVI